MRYGVCKNMTADQSVEPSGPSPWPFIGNALDIASADGSNDAILHLLDKYEGMVLLHLHGGRNLICSRADVLEDMLERPNDFAKIVRTDSLGLGNLRARTIASGLFTSSDSDELWQIAHRILLPGFGVEAIRDYYNRMVEVGDELLGHLEAMPPGQPILITEWMTRMTFEAIGYAGFSTRFHCMDQPQMPPFVQAMVTSLRDAMQASWRIFPASLYFLANQRRKKADLLQRKIVTEIIQERKTKMARGETFPHDLLQLMLIDKDRVTGKQLPEENICSQLITFLIAGHETTSGLLSYALYQLISHPEIQQLLIQEVDTVLGRDFTYRPTYDDLEKLPYTLRVLKESLRLNPTAPGFAKTAMQDTVVAGIYKIKKGDITRFYLPALHRDPHYWPDPERFDPDRFLPEAESKRHPGSYHPFGGGMRACIGFQFALKEATMVLARLYQRFKFHFQDPNYKLQHIRTLTVKPKDLFVVIERRTETKGSLPKPAVPKTNLTLSPIKANAPPILLLVGSNMGTCQEIAQKLALHAQTVGYRPIVRELDSQVDKSWDCPYVMIITSTYNGTPPDNAAAFEKWLKNLTGSPFASLYYSVLGVGNKQWHATFQAFPNYVNARMQALGAHCYCPIGAADVDGDYDQTIETWAKNAWKALQKLCAPVETTALEETSLLTYACEIVNFAGAISHKIPCLPIDQQAQAMRVLENKELLSNVEGRSIKHIEISLAENTSYRAGDHLGVLPENPSEAVELAAKLCNVRLNDWISIKKLQEPSQTEKLPIGIPISVQDLLTSFVDLLGPVSRKELRMLAQHCACPPEKKALEELSNSAFAEEITAKERSFLDLCQQFRSVTCSLDLLLSARPLLKPRYYSISSSPLMMKETVSLTVGVQIHAIAASGMHKGICSNYLAQVAPSKVIQCFVKDTRSHFRLPEDTKQDIILIGPGTGLAPLRGFLQERCMQKAQGIPVGRQLLFFGCRHPDRDYLYRTELESYQASGLLQGLFVAFSRHPPIPKCYVQDLLKQQAPLVWEFVQNNARIFVCGDGKRMAPCVRQTLKEIFAQEGKLTADEAAALFKQKESAYLYVEDVWAAQ